jgi:tripartite-type tricarboxylate transporter receptor subunit TctC
MLVTVMRGPHGLSRQASEVVDVVNLRPNLLPRRGLLLGTLAVPALARAQSTTSAAWPTRPVRFIVPFQAGGPVEIPARFIAEHLAPLLGQPVIVEPKPGAGGALGIQYVVQQNDPHTILFTTSAVAILPALMKQPGFDPLADLTPVSMVMDAPMVLLVRQDSPLRSLAQLLEQAKARPGRISYGSSGAGSTTHLGGALLGVKAGVEMLHIPYRGAAQAVNALYAGDTDLMVTGAGEALPHVKEGRLRALCVTSAHRIARLPDVPAAAELVPGYAMTIWYAMLGPRGMPAEVVQRIATAIAPLRQGSALAQRAEANAQELLLDGPAPLAERLAREVPQWKTVARQAHIQAE